MKKKCTKKETKAKKKTHGESYSVLKKKTKNNNNNNNNKIYVKNDNFGKKEKLQS